MLWQSLFPWTEGLCCGDSCPCLLRWLFLPSPTWTRTGTLALRYENLAGFLEVKAKKIWRCSQTAALKSSSLRLAYTWPQQVWKVTISMSLPVWLKRLLSQVRRSWLQFSRCTSLSLSRFGGISLPYDLSSQMGPKKSSVSSCSAFSLF